MGYPHKPHARETTVLSKHFGNREAITLDGWKKLGGYKALETALGMAPAEIGRASCRERVSRCV